MTELKTRPLPPFTYDFSGCFPLCGEGGLLLCSGVVSLLEKKEMAVNALAVLIGDYNIYRKKAATLILRALLPPKVYKAILSEGAVYPFERNDRRVTAWKRAVLAPGRCAFCGAEKDLEAHHIIGWAEWPQGRIDVSNGLCLCHKCHTLSSGLSHDACEGRVILWPKSLTGSARKS